MSSFKDGRFVFIDAEQRLRVEGEKNSNTFTLLYGGVVLAFAINEAQRMMALVCPSNAATGLTPFEYTDAEKCCVRLFGLTDDGLGDLVTELEVPMANQILWVGERFLVASYPRTLTTIMELTKKTKLKVFVQDKGTFPVTVGGLLGLFSGADTSASVEVWDLQKNKRVETIRLEKKTSGKRGGERKGQLTSAAPIASSQVISSHSSGNFAVLGNADGSFDTLYGGGKSSVKLLTRVKPPSQGHCGRSPAGNKDGSRPATKQTDRKDERIVCAAPSPSHLVVGSSGLREVGKFSYFKKEAKLHEEGVLHVAEGDILMAVTPTRFLVQKAVDEVQTDCLASTAKKAVYAAYPITLTTIPTGPLVAAQRTNERDAGATDEAAAAASGTDDDDKDAMGRKKRKRNRKKKNGATLDEDESTKVVGGSSAGTKTPSSNAGGVSALALAIGIASLVSVLAVIQLRRRGS